MQLYLTPQEVATVILAMSGLLFLLALIAVLLFVTKRSQLNKQYESHSFYEESKRLRSAFRISDVESEGQGVSDHIV